MREPMFNLPPVTAALAGLLVIVHGLRQLLSEREDLWLDFTFGVLPARYGLALDWPAIVAPVTHSVLHAGWLHLAINVATLAAFGSGVERMLGGARMLLVFLATAALGALLHVLVYAGDVVPVVGASGGISGLFGVILVLLHRRGQLGGSLKVVAVVWILVAVVTGVIGVPGQEDLSIAWVVHIAGFVAGLALAPLVARR
jgi:membrane associated rhomboid family serine protease